MIKDEEVKKMILEAGMRVFRKWGFNKTTMEDIAAEAGKGKSTLYYYYKSKDEIFHDAVYTEMWGMITKSMCAVEDISNAKDQLRNYIVTLLTELKHSVTIYGIVQSEILGNRQMVERVKNIVENIQENAIRKILKSGVEQGQFFFATENELELAAKVLVGMLNSMLLYLFLENGDSAEIDMAAKLIANGI